MYQEIAMNKILISLLMGLVSINVLAEDQNFNVLNAKVEAITNELEELKTKNQKNSSKISFGGYGEFTYNNKRSEREDGQKVAHAQNSNLDAQRFILYIGYQFNENWSLISELELEHANSIFLEQGFLQNKISDNLNFQVGVLLAPIGITNLYHEPTTFNSVERPGVENKIIPTTWRELGLGFSGVANKFKYKIYILNGLDASKFSSSGVRSGRKKASSSEAKALSYAVRGDYALLPNFEIGFSAYIGKADGVKTNVKHNIWDIHFLGQIHGIVLKGLYTHTKIDNVLELNNELGKTGSSSIAEEMKGHYIEVGYNLLHKRSHSRITPFVRFEQFDTQDKVASGFTKDLSKNITNVTYGVSYQPIGNIIFKADYMKSKNKAKTGFDTWSLGLGWTF